MNLRRLAELARRAESGDAAAAARDAVAGATDADERTLSALMRYAAAVAPGDADDFDVRDPNCYLLRVPGLGEFWLAPLRCWSELPPGVVVSPRGLRALGAAVTDAFVGAAA